MAITVVPEELPDGEVGTRYRAELSAEGGTAPHAFAVSGGALPPGLALSAAGLIAGMSDEAGEFSFIVTATDAQGRTGSRSYAVGIAEAPVVIVISPEALPDGEVAERYRATLTAEGGTEPRTSRCPAGRCRRGCRSPRPGRSPAGRARRASSLSPSPPPMRTAIPAAETMP